MFDLYCCPYSFQFHSYHRRHYTSKQRVGCVLRTFSTLCLYMYRPTHQFCKSLIPCPRMFMSSQAAPSLLYHIYTANLVERSACFILHVDHCLPTHAPPLRKHRSYIKALPNFPFLVLHILCIYTYIYIHILPAKYMYVCIFVNVCLIYEKLILHVVPSPHRTRLSPRFWSYT